MQPAGMEKAASAPLNPDPDGLGRPGSRTNMMRFRPAPLQQPGGSFTGRGPQGKGPLSPIGKSAEGVVSPFARTQVQKLSEFSFPYVSLPIQPDVTIS